MGLANSVPWTLLALYLDHARFNKAEIGAIQSADALGKMLVAIPAAFLLTRRKSGPIFVRAALIAGAAYLTLPWLAGMAAVSLCNWIAGLALAVHYIAIAPFLFRHTGPKERATVFAMAESVRTLATVVGAFSAGRFVTFLAPRLGSEKEALGWAVTLGGLAALCSAHFYAKIDEQAPALRKDQPILPVLRQHAGVLFRFACPQLLIAAGSGFCISFLSLYFKDRFALSPGEWGNLSAAGQVLMTTGFMLTPLLLSRVGFMKSIVLVELASIPFFLILAYTTSLPVAIVAFLLRGALMNSTHPVHKNFMMQATPEGAREVQIGINATLWGLGWTIGPYVAGKALLATNDDYTVLMLTTVGLYLASGLATWLLLGPVDRKLRNATAQADAGSGA